MFYLNRLRLQASLTSYVLQDNLVGLANQIHLLRTLDDSKTADVILEGLMAKVKSLPPHLEKRKIGELLLKLHPFAAGFAEKLPGHLLTKV